jgi:hypothetical protein
VRAGEKIRQVVYEVPFDELHVVGARVHRQSGAFHVAVGQLHRKLAAFRICFALRQPLKQKEDRQIIRTVHGLTALDKVLDCSLPAQAVHRLAHLHVPINSLQRI